MYKKRNEKTPCGHYEQKKLKPGFVSFVIFYTMTTQNLNGNTNDKFASKLAMQLTLRILNISNKDILL